MVKIVKFDPKLPTLEGTTMRHKTITITVTAAQYAKLEAALKAARKDVPALKTVEDLVKYWLEAELAQ